ncbi:MAG: hypothetical protein IPG26_07775 [Coprothermobacter sp.]|nr:hypothetical protein [Coprothermobacter sp.]
MDSSQKRPYGVGPDRIHDGNRTFRGFKVIVTAVAAEGLDSSWLGRQIDQKMLNELKDLNRRYGVHPAFEGGEAETFVLDGPIFKKRIKILKAEKCLPRMVVCSNRNKGCHPRG